MSPSMWAEPLRRVVRAGGSGFRDGARRDMFESEPESSELDGDWRDESALDSSAGLSSEGGGASGCLRNHLAKPIFTATLCLREADDVERAGETRRESLVAACWEHGVGSSEGSRAAGETERSTILRETWASR